MRIGKAELSVVFLLVTIALGVYLETYGYRTWRTILDESSQKQTAEAGFLFFVTGLGCLSLAFCGGLFWIVPLVRIQTQERGKLQSLAGALSERSRDLERAALTDALTGISNRRYFDTALQQYLAEFSRIGKPLGVLVLDIDHFKSVNDTYGHDIGDEVLKAVSNCMFEFTRYHDIAARLGGEEFAIVAPAMTAMELCALADRIRKAIAKLPLEIGNIRLRVTVSIGLASSRTGDTPVGLLKRADVALYQAKQQGRNRVCA